VPVFTPVSPVHRLQSTSLFLLALSASVGLLYYGRAFCITLVISVMMAFILDPFVAFVMRIRISRGVASFIVCAVALSLFYLMGLGAFTEIATLSAELPAYSERANELVDNVADRIDKMEQNAYKLLVPKRMQERDRIAQVQAQQNETKKRRSKVPDPVAPPVIQEVRIRQDRTSLVNYFYSYVSSYYNVLLMTSFVPFLVYFMLSWRDHVRRSFLTLFEGADRVIAGKSWQSIADMARAYVFGNFLLGILLSIASCAAFYSWHLPYWLLIGPLSGFLSLVPYVGLPLAIAPPMLAALAVYSNPSPYLLIAATIAFFHLIALNLLYPKIVGARVHLNPLAVTVALMFWGTIWGGIGLVLAIPITAAIKAVLDNIEHLQPYGRMLGD
jgi:predicted PurR-regulated permease PerM